MLDKSILNEAITLISQCVINQCVNPPGNEMKSIKTLQDYLVKFGVVCQVFETAPNRGVLVARIKGTGNAPSLMLGPSHVDVVPVNNASEWKVPPFAGTVDADRIWGRGTLDMLYITVTQAVAFAHLVQEGFHPKGDLVYCAVADEEKGGIYGIQWLKEHHPDLIKVDYCVSEGAGAILQNSKMTVAIAEKGICRKQLHFKGTSGHGSLPYAADSALLKAAQAAQRIARYVDRHIPLDTTYLKYIAEGLGIKGIKRVMLTSKYLLNYILPIIMKTQPSMAKFLHALSRMTISPNILHSEVKINVIPDRADLLLDIRMLPNQDESYVDVQIRKALGTLAKYVEITNMEGEDILSYASASDPHDQFMEVMRRAVIPLQPDLELVPFILTGASDLRFIREMGGQSYGFSFMSPKSNIEEVARLGHGTDEHILIDTVELSLNAYYNLVREMWKET